MILIDIETGDFAGDLGIKEVVLLVIEDSKVIKEAHLAEI